MKIAPVSGDLLVKLAVGALAVGAVIYAMRKANDYGQAAADRILQLAREAADKVNPLSDQNLAYQGANAAVSAVTGRDETLGGWIYSATHADPVTAGAPATPSDQIDQTFGSVGGFYSQPGALY